MLDPYLTDGCIEHLTFDLTYDVRCAYLNSVWECKCQLFCMVVEAACHLLTDDDQLRAACSQDSVAVKRTNRVGLST